MRPLHLILVSLLLALCPAFGAELAFDKAEEFPPSAYGLIAENRVVWFGEMHGTLEAPEPFLGLVSLIANHYSAPRGDDWRFRSPATVKRAPGVAGTGAAAHKRR